MPPLGGVLLLHGVELLPDPVNGGGLILQLLQLQLLPELFLEEAILFFPLLLLLFVSPGRLDLLGGEGEGAVDVLDVLCGDGEEVILFPEFLVDLIIDLPDVVLICIFLGLVNLLSRDREPLIALFGRVVGPPQDFLVAGLGGQISVLRRILGGGLVKMLPASVESLL